MDPPEDPLEDITAVRLLVAEDEKRLASFLAKGLRENGYAVDVAHDGEDAAHLGKTGRYDVILLDIMLPKQSGFVVLREIRDRDRLEDQLQEVGLEGVALAHAAPL